MTPLMLSGLTPSAQCTTARITPYNPRTFTVDLSGEFRVWSQAIFGLFERFWLAGMSDADINNDNYRLSFLLFNSAGKVRFFLSCPKHVHHFRTRSVAALSTRSAILSLTVLALLEYERPRIWARVSLLVFWLLL